jgi:histidinol phosphatase-like enzyme (inositol monophosphatase family)
MDRDPLERWDAPDGLRARTALLRTVAAAAAAAVLRHYQRPGLSVERKADESPVTQADRESEALIRAAIAAAFPGDAILGEEEGHARGTSRWTWVIDPIDGTVSFAAGVPLFGVLLALEEATPAGPCVVAGSCELPALGERVWAARGAGAWWERPGHAPQRARVSGIARLGDALCCTSGPEYFTRGGCEDAALRMVRSVGRLRGWSDCYALALVATGRADLAIDPVMHPWDCGPFPVIVEEAGGTFTDWQGRPGIHGGSSVAANPALHAQALAMLRGVAQ